MDRCSPGTLISTAQFPLVSAVRVSVPANAMSNIVRNAATLAGYNKIESSSRGQSGSLIFRKRVQLRHIQVKEESALLVRWHTIDKEQTLIEWTAYIQTVGQITAEPHGQQQFARLLESELLPYFAPKAPLILDRDPLVPPGAISPKRYEGQLYDYSRLATPDELRALQRGTLPLGRCAFGREGYVRHHEHLFLPKTNSHPQEELGLLICAPQGAGKTHLLLRWAAWAARAGRSVFIVDVKGNMRKPLERQLALSGAKVEILEFTTAPHGTSDRWNPLAGISADQVDCAEQLTRLAEALLPDADYEGEAQMRYRIQIRILRGAMQLLKLMEWHRRPEHLITADLTDLYTLISSEQNLRGHIADLRRWAPQGGGIYSVEDCVGLLKLALGNHTWTLQYADGTTIQEQFTDGQRPPDATYEDYVVRILDALDPFRPGGYMAARSRSSGPGQEIRLDHFGRDRQQIVILSPREQDSSLATAVLGMAIRRLRDNLEERRNLTPAQRGEVLLLLDETRRIPRFDAAEFASIVREDRIGYVFVYQSLNFIGEPQQISALLRNIGTQVYLQGLATEDLEYFNKMMGEVQSTRIMATGQGSPSGGPTKGFTTVASNVPFLTALAAAKFPSGRHPALIYIRNGPPPFLVDLDDNVLLRT